MAELQELLARLQGTASNPPPPQSHPYQQPSVSSPIFSPSPNGPQPHHQSAVLSPNSSAANTPGPEQGAQQTPQQQSVQLLNLLRFNSQPSVVQARRPSQNTQPSDSVSNHGRAVSASDLVASFTGGKAAHAPTSAAPPAARPELASVSSQNPQDLLMRLLNHPKPSQTEISSSRTASAVAFSPLVASHMPETAIGDVTQELVATTLEDAPAEPPATQSTVSPMRVFGSDGGQTPFEPETTPSGSTEPPRFTYRNPFEQLEAASPRNRTPAPEHSKPSAPKMEILKPKHSMDGASSTSGCEGNGQPPQKSRKLSPPVSHEHETVAEAVSGVGEHVEKEIKEVLAQAEGTIGAEGVKELERMSPGDIKEIEESIVKTATEIKKELEDETNVKALEEQVPKPIADALKQVTTDIAERDIADSWESAEDRPADETQTVIVYRFPMRAFASITVKDMPPLRTFFPADLIMDVARLKKEFDQIDRSLVSASKNYIVYAITKRGGFRIIRQETGQYRQVFENHQERLFNIALCVGGADSIQPSVESILGIGINGTVFWTAIDRGLETEFDDIDMKGLMLPPSPSQDDNTSGGQLKTRAKPSSRHPEFFAVGRGKAIHIVWPRIAAEYVRPRSRVVHTEKYLKERSLKILTGKAGKDFTFSEDDTVIVSLDKAGRMRFWDIRPLTELQVADPELPPQQVEVSQTMLEFHTTSANAKSWPTSVFFFDKEKPFKMGIALRYVMVGMKQNHAFQLWDLGLGKAVQEINLPHEKESDAICSVGFHPKTGIMAVAHPTRNSIFFIHVSCPRYGLPVMNQATYISRIVNKNNERSQQLPPVNATAIMTSITEYSFSPKGQIRSLHMLNEPAGPPDEDLDNAALFELYVMHSKGVCTLRIRRGDLGWKKEGEPMHAKEAEEEGIISFTQLKPVVAPVDESTTSGDTPGPKSVSERSARETIKKESSAISRQTMTPEAAMRASTLAKVESKQDAARAAIINGSEKSQKKKSKRAIGEAASQLSTATRTAPPSYAQAAQSTPRSKSPIAPETAIEATSSKATDSEAPEWAKKWLSSFQERQPAATTLDTKKLADVVQAEINKGLSQYTDGVYKRLDDEKRISSAQNRANQEAILRLVSSTLTENVEGVIRKMVDENMREVLLPGMLTQMSSTIEKNVGNVVKSSLSPQISKEVPEVVSRVLKNPQFIQSLSDQVSKRVTISLEHAMTTAVGSALTPFMSNMTSLVEQKISNQLHQAQLQHREDGAKIHLLTENVQTCLQTIQAMAASQAEMQGQLANMRQLLAQVSQSGLFEAPSVQQLTAPAPQKSPIEIEAEQITRLMSEGHFEQGTYQWVHSEFANQLFDKVFARWDPAYLGQVSTLLVLSTGAVVTNSLQENMYERLVWLDTVLKVVNPNDAEARDVMPSIMDVFKERLTHAYIRLNEESPGDPLLRRIAALVKGVNDVNPPTRSNVNVYGPRA